MKEVIMFFDIKKNKRVNKWTGIFLVSFIFVLGFHPNGLLTEKIGEHDDAAYLSHALTIALDFDLNYENEPAGAHLNIHGTPVGPIGPGLLAAPFVAFFSIFDRLTGHPIYQNHLEHTGSWSLFGFLFSTIIYFWISIFFYFNAAQKIVIRISSSFLFFLVISSGIIFYVLGRFTMGHVFEFFALSLVFWGTVQLWYFSGKKIQATSIYDKKMTHLLAIGSGVVLTLAVRPGNVNVLLLPYLLLLLLYIFQGEGRKDSWKNYLQIFLSVLILYLPLAFLYLKMYSGFYEGSYDIVGGIRNSRLPKVNNFTTLVSAILTLLKLSPNLIALLFSSEFGLVYSNPILVFGIVSLFYLLLKKLNQVPKKALLPLVIMTGYVGLPVAIVLFWKTTASTYGYRYLLSIFPLAFLGYLLWYHNIYQSKEKSFLKAVQLVFCALCLFSILGQIFYGSSEKLKTRSQVNVFGIEHEASAKGFNTELIKSIFSLNAWISLNSQRLPGYIGVKTLELLSIDVKELGPKIGLSESVLEEKKEFIERFQNASYQVSFQILILFFVWLVGIFTFFFPVSLHSFFILHSSPVPQS